MKEKYSKKIRVGKRKIHQNDVKGEGIFTIFGSEERKK
jgi:hypothetical protein